jgi:hypothetical protein
MSTPSDPCESEWMPMSGWGPSGWVTMLTEDLLDDEWVASEGDQQTEIVVWETTRTRLDHLAGNGIRVPRAWQLPESR